ncbi:MAG TPA: tol-pal system protein YbgF [Candidatus Binatia bacterium]|jgi:tol-pal system protein YbgF
MNRPYIVVFALAAAALPACVTPQQVDIIEREQRTLRSQTTTSRGDLDSIRASLADTSANVDQMRREINALKEKMEEVRYQLDRQIGRSTKEGDQRIKDLEAKVGKVGEELKAQAALLKQRDEEIRSLREGMQGRTAESAPPGAVTDPRDKAAPESEAAKKDYDDAWRLVERKEYRAAIPRLREFLKKHPNSALADNAQYWLGECYYGLKEYDQAILEFDAVRRRYPKGDKVPAALLKQGFAFAELGDKVDARLILQELVDRFPQSEEAGRAKQRLKTLGS